MRKLFINLFMFSLTLNSFAYFKEKKELIYRSFRERKIVSKEQLVKLIQDFIDEPWDVPLKKMENNEFVANILCYMYAHKIFLTDFSEEEVIKELKIFMTEAIKEGSEDALEVLYLITETSLAVCIKAMQLMLTNDLYDYIRLCRTCEQWFEEQYKEVLKDILGGDDIYIIQYYPKNLRFAPSPVNFEFNTVNLDRLKKFLNDMCPKETFYEVIALSLESWYNLCKKNETIYTPSKGLGFGGFFNKKNIRLFPDFRSLFFQRFLKRKIVSKENLDDLFKYFEFITRENSLKDIEYNVFFAQIFGDMYENKFFLPDFSEEEVIKQLKKYMTEAIKEGSEDVLKILCGITKTPLAVCIIVMELLLKKTITIQDCVRLRWACEEYFKGQSYKEVLKDILGRDDIDDIPEDCPEVTFGVIEPGPLELEFNEDTFYLLKKFLKDKCQEDTFYVVIDLSLDSWYEKYREYKNLRSSAKKPYKGLDIGGFSKFL